MIPNHYAISWTIAFLLKWIQIKTNLHWFLKSKLHVPLTTFKTQDQVILLSKPFRDLKWTAFMSDPSLHWKHLITSSAFHLMWCSRNQTVHFTCVTFPHQPHHTKTKGQGESYMYGQNYGWEIVHRQVLLSWCLEKSSAQNNGHNK